MKMDNLYFWGLQLHVSICTPDVGRINYLRSLLSKRKEISLEGAQQLTFSPDSASVNSHTDPQRLLGTSQHHAAVPELEGITQPAQAVLHPIHFLWATHLSSSFLLKAYGETLRQNSVFLLFSPKETSWSQILHLPSKLQIKGVIPHPYIFTWIKSA